MFWINSASVCVWYMHVHTCTHIYMWVHTYRHMPVWVHTRTCVWDVHTFDRVITRSCHHFYFLWTKVKRGTKKKKICDLQGSTWKNCLCCFHLVSQPSWLVLSGMHWHCAAEPSVTAAAGLCSRPSSHPCTCVLPRCQKVCWLSPCHGYYVNLSPEAHEH